MKRSDVVLAVVGTAALAVFVAVGLLFYFNLRELLAMSHHAPLTGEPSAERAPSSPSGPAPAPVVPGAPSPRPPPSPTPAPTVRGGPPPPDSRTLVTEVEPKLEAPLKAVKKEVERCFVDQAAHHGEPGVVRVRFRPMADGGFADVRVESDAWQDPYLDACLTDVFEELTYQPSGREDFATTVHTFRFEAVR